MRTWAMLALQRCEGVPFGGMNLAHLVAHNNAGEDRSDASLRAKQKAFIAHCLMAQFPAGSLLAWSAADNKIHHHVDDLGNTPLMTALTHGHAKVAVVILAVVSTSLTRQDAYFAQRNVDGHTALDLAVLHHHAHPGCLEEVCRFMQTEDVELGIRAMDPACGDHFTPLAVAVAHGSRRAAKILLQSLAKMYLTQYGNKLGRRAMMRCVTRRDADEHSALSIATEASDVRMVALLKSFYK
jgi:ankyrin repeat protein